MGRSRKILDSILLEELLKEAVSSGPANIQRMAIGYAIASLGNFQFSPTSSNPSTSSGIRLNPSESNKDLGATEIESLLNSDAKKIGIDFGDSIGPDKSKGEGSLSGKFTSFPALDASAWLQTPEGKKWIIKTLVNAKGIDEQTAEKEISSWKKGKGKYLTNVQTVVVNARSLQSRLWTGQGQGELAEYAVAGAINGNSDAEFNNAIKGAILAPSWKNANGGSEDPDPQTDAATKFRASFDKMLEKAQANMSSASSDQNTTVAELFGSSAAVQGGGGGRYDVETDSARIHVKFDEPSRLSGLQQTGISKRHAVTDADSLNAKIAQLEFGKADAYWKYMRDEFKKRAGITSAKDKEPLMNLGFYEWLLDGTVTPKLQAGLDQNPDFKSWISGQSPDIASHLKTDLKQEFMDILPAGATPEGGNYFYFTFYPKGDNEFTLKIEEINPGEGIISAVPNLQIAINPNYKGAGGGSIGTPYVAIDSETGEEYIELEFRAKASAKPIQLHRGESFGSASDENKKSMTITLVNEIRKRIREIIQEEKERASESKLSSVTESILLEELTRSDKKDIEKMIKKRIEADRSEQKKIIQKELAAELKKTLGRDFFGNPGKLGRAIQEIANEELMKGFSRGQARDEVVEISKKVLKKFYREISFSSSPFIDRIKL